MKNKSKLIESYSLTFCVIVLHGYASSEWRNCNNWYINNHVINFVSLLTFKFNFLLEPMLAQLKNINKKIIPVKKLFGEILIQKHIIWHLVWENYIANISGKCFVVKILSIKTKVVNFKK
jgi:hypothetical protein